ncbi:MAG TPA: galactokinase [Ignavibacteriales bacterium]|nr:galactokinase [Ignavibacteriales bacterium]
MDYLNVETKFKSLFGGKPVIVRSPGRVNLIGEHTDYNEGFVLPAAIDKEIVFAAAPNAENKCRFFAINMNESFETDVNNIMRSPLGWPNYLLGVVEQLKLAGYKINGFNCVFEGDIPIGSGLSSSAALEAGMLTALNCMFGYGISKLDIIKMAQKAENEFVGVKCGIMDQFISVLGEKNKVLKLDCRSLTYEKYTLETDDMNIVLFDTQVKHSLASSEYNVRRSQCETGVAVIRKYNQAVHSLRDLSLPELIKHKKELEPIVFDRCEYVLEENARLHEACGFLEKGNYADFGEMMYGSHAGLRDKYEVSCKELDLLVDIAHESGRVLGARMMGGGFGGCTINLISNENLDYCKVIEQEYRKRSGKDLKKYICKIKNGTEILRA